jgi:hypothetical protein
MARRPPRTDRRKGLLTKLQSQRPGRYAADMWVSCACWWVCVCVWRGGILKRIRQPARRRIRALGIVPPKFVNFAKCRCRACNQLLSPLCRRNFTPLCVSLTSAENMERTVRNARLPCVLGTHGTKRTVGGGPPCVLPCVLPGVLAQQERYRAFSGATRTHGGLHPVFGARWRCDDIYCMLFNATNRSIHGWR